MGDPNLRALKEEIRLGRAALPLVKNRPQGISLEGNAPLEIRVPQLGYETIDYEINEFG